MPQAKKKAAPAARKQPVKKHTRNDKRAVVFVKKVAGNIRKRTRAFLARRPHRSFRRTYRRDYVRSLKAPGYVSFTKEVTRTLWSRKKIFLGLALLYALLILAFGGVTGQEVYNEIAKLVKESSTEVFEGSWGKVGQAGLLLVSAFTGGRSVEPEQQVYLAAIFLLAWLATVWLLREIMAKRKPKLRDGLYNSGAPIVSTFLVAFVGLLQLIPVGIMAIVYTGLSASGMIAGGFASMLFYITAGLVVLLCLYWLTSTFIGMVVVTLPGMYPIQALRTAGDLVVGRRMRIVFRLLWCTLILLVLWAVVMIPIIMFDDWLKNTWTQIAWLPIVPIFVALLTALSMIWFSAYVYLFYRRIVEDDAKPA